MFMHLLIYFFNFYDLQRTQVDLTYRMAASGRKWTEIREKLMAKHRLKVFLVETLNLFPEIAIYLLNIAHLTGKNTCSPRKGLITVYIINGSYLSKRHHDA